MVLQFDDQKIVVPMRPPYFNGMWVAGAKRQYLADEYPHLLKQWDKNIQLKREHARFDSSSAYNRKRSHRMYIRQLALKSQAS